MEKRSQTGNKVKIQVSNITVIAPDDGSNGATKPEIKLSIGKPSFDSQIQGVDMPSDPIIEKEGDNYSITFEFTVNTSAMPRNLDELVGTVRVPVIASAINLCNGKVSTRQSNLSVSFLYEREKVRRSTTPQRRR